MSRAAAVGLLVFLAAGVGAYFLLTGRGGDVTLYRLSPDLGGVASQGAAKLPPFLGYPVVASEVLTERAALRKVLEIVDRRLGDEPHSGAQRRFDCGIRLVRGDTTTEVLVSLRDRVVLFAGRGDDLEGLDIRSLSAAEADDLTGILGVLLPEPAR